MVEKNFTLLPYEQHETIEKLKGETKTIKYNNLRKKLRDRRKPITS